jgi:hypothetical protein
MDKRKFVRALAVCWSIGVLLVSAAFFSRLGWAQLGSNTPTDAELQAQRASEIASGFEVAVPVPGTVLRPVQRVPREPGCETSTRWSFLMPRTTSARRCWKA